MTGIPSQALQNVMKLSETEKAYLAGLFDGEGCVGYYSRGVSKEVQYHSASLHIAMTDPKAITWLMDKLSVGKVSIIAHSGRRKTVYSWQVCRKAHVREILELIRPYLLTKADQVELLLKLLAMEDAVSGGHGSLTPTVLAFRQHVTNELKRLKTA